MWALEPGADRQIKVTWRLLSEKVIAVERDVIGHIAPVGQIVDRELRFVVLKAVEDGPIERVLPRNRRRLVIAFGSRQGSEQRRRQAVDEAIGDRIGIGCRKI
jgi:hypothetical protein